MRAAVRIALVKHRLLRFCSKSYREHDAIVSDREHWRREYITALNEKAAALRSTQEAEEVANGLRDRLRNAIEAQQRASEQLIAERALRQASDERAERYHAELTEALKSNVDWLARGLYHRRPMFGVGALPDEARSEPQVDVPVKPMARRVAQDRTNETLNDLLKSIRGGSDGMPVGPEFTTQ